VRALLGKSGIKPEELPIEEDIKKLERKIKSLDKSIAKKNLKKISVQIDVSFLSNFK
jgi:DNA-damage-inducible protein D